jgi:hypothetical protein
MSHRLFRGDELHHRLQRPQQLALGLPALPRLHQAQQLDHPEGEKEGRLCLHLEVGQGLHVQRLLRERGAERRAPPGVVARQGNTRRIPPTAQSAFQVRVICSIGAMARTPSESPDTGTATAPSSSISAVGNIRVPSFSLSRRIRRPLGCPCASWSSR